jgi:hypothetical protein
MRSLPRFIPALVLVTLYALIVLSPLAPLAMRSAVVAHALTGECTGDCGICGCAPERSASHTCCCWQKKLQQEHGDDQDEPDCCKKIHAENNNKIVSFTSLPCGSAKAMALVGVEQTDVLPFHFTQGIFVVFETPLVESNPLCLADWPGDPPDPPPKFSFLS